LIVRLVFFLVGQDKDPERKSSRIEKPAATPGQLDALKATRKIGPRGEALVVAVGKGPIEFVAITT
jgi:hypothetical protein